MRGREESNGGAGDLERSPFATQYFLLQVNADLLATRYAALVSADYGKANEWDGGGGGGFVEGCHPKVCNRMVFDDFLDEEGVAKLRSMAERAIEAGRGNGGRPGPTIVDINSGFLRDDEGLEMIYEGEEGSDIFTKEEYEFYGDVIERIRRTVGAENGLGEGFPVFTAPTFITRIKFDVEWRPKSMHDVYWMPHVDKNNTGHYDYSGLLYLTTYGEDFEGSMFEFVELSDEETTEQQIVPKRGRLISFTAGNENPHRLNLIEGGTRFVLSFWFSCDMDKRFENFLDGKGHDSFERGGEL